MRGLGTHKIAAAGVPAIAPEHARGAFGDGCGLHLCAALGVGLALLGPVDGGILAGHGAAIVLAVLPREVDRQHRRDGRDPHRANGELALHGVAVALPAELVKARRPPAVPPPIRRSVPLST